jgi:hypothetical protein
MIGGRRRPLTPTSSSWNSFSHWWRPYLETKTLREPCTAEPHPPDNWVSGSILLDNYDSLYMTHRVMTLLAPVAYFNALDRSASPHPVVVEGVNEVSDEIRHHLLIMARTVAFILLAVCAFSLSVEVSLTSSPLEQIRLHAHIPALPAKGRHLSIISHGRRRIRSIC